MLSKWWWLIPVGAFGLGVTQLIVGLSRREERDELQQPLWPGATLQWVVPLGAFGGVLVGLGLRLGFILGAAFGLPVAALAWVAMHMMRNRHVQRIEDEALSLLIELEGSLSMGSTLQEALKAFVSEQQETTLGKEVQRFVLRPLAAGQRLATVLTTLEEAPRYRGYPYLRRLWSTLARGTRSGLSPEELWGLLSSFEGVSDMVVEMRREMIAESEQMRMARWIVAFLLAGGVTAVAILWPQAQDHWFNETPGQIAMLVITFLGSVAIVTGELLGEPVEVEF